MFYLRLDDSRTSLFARFRYIFNSRAPRRRVDTERNGKTATLQFYGFFSLLSPKFYYGTNH